MLTTNMSGNRSIIVSYFNYRLPVNERRGYKNVFNALYRITTEEGVLTLWRVSDDDYMMNYRYENSYLK